METSTGPSSTRTEAELASSLKRLGTAMLAVGVCRCALGIYDEWEAIAYYASELRSVAGGSPWPRLPWNGIDALQTGWLLAVGLMLRWLGWPRLAKGALVLLGAFVLARLIGFGLGATVAANMPGPWRTRLTVGFATGLGTRGLLIAAVRGTCGVSIDLVLAAWAWRLVRAAGRAGIDRDRSGRRGIVSRQLALGSFVVALLLLGDHGWYAYEDLLDISPQFRRLVILSDPMMTGGTGRRIAAMPRQPANETLGKLNEAIALHASGRYGDAKRIYSPILAMIGEVRDPRRRFDLTGATSQIALSANNLSWALVTGPDPESRDPRGAVRLAELALKLAPRDGNTWNTLGVAHFRAGDLESAQRAFNESARFRSGGDAFDWYFLAMIEARAGRMLKARDWYDRAVAWSERNRPGDRELQRFRAEAAETLGIALPPAPTSGPGLSPPAKRLRPSRRTVGTN